MIVRQLRPEDAREHEKVASQAFVFGFDADDPNLTLPSGYMLGAFLDDNKTLMADFEVEDKYCNFGNGELLCACIGGVASKPEYRGRGAIKAVYAELFKNSRWDISILYPFSNAYYRKFGYESMGMAMEFVVPFSTFSVFPRNSEAVIYEGGDKHQVLDIYNAYAKKNNLAFLRDENMMGEFSSKPYSNKRYTYTWQDRALITFSPDRAERTINVDEICYLDKEALVKILGFMRNFEGNYATIDFKRIPISSPIVHLISDERWTKRYASSMGAARILNVENVLKTHSYPAEKGGFAVQVEDCIESNNSVFEVEYENGTAVSVKRNPDAKPDVKPDVKLNINAASIVLLVGVNGKEELEYMNGAEILNDNPDFFRAVYKNEAFFRDGF